MVRNTAFPEEGSQSSSSSSEALDDELISSASESDTYPDLTSSSSSGYESLSDYGEETSSSSSSDESDHVHTTTDDERPWVDSSTSEKDSDDEIAFQTDLGEAYFNKKTHRLLKSNCNEILEHLKADLKKRSDAREGTTFETESLLKSDINSFARKEGPWRCLELLKTNEEFADNVNKFGWEYIPNKLRDISIETPEGREEYRQYLRETDPDLIIIHW